MLGTPEKGPAQHWPSFLATEKFERFGKGTASSRAVGGLKNVAGFSP
jgi:hypothetical protein